MGSISYKIRKLIPRKHMHRALKSASGVLGTIYSGNKMECPVCGKTSRKFLSFGATRRQGALCPNCFSLERHRLMWLYIRDKSGLLAGKGKVLHIAPEKCFISKLENNLGDNYITADLDSPLAKVKMNIEQIQFPDGEFDAIFCNHVLEHVGDDRKAIGELYRVMKPGGWGIMIVPLNPQRETTYEDPAITTKDGREKAFGQWDHLREYGMDYFSRLENAGFVVEIVDARECFTAEEHDRYGLSGEKLFVVRKPATKTQ